MRVYYDRDADVNLIKGKKVVIVGYGSQGRAHALNLKDSGAKELVIALKAGSPTIKKAEADGLKVMTVAEDDVYKVNFRLGFRVPNKINLYFRSGDPQGASLHFLHYRYSVFIV